MALRVLHMRRQTKLAWQKGSSVEKARLAEGCSPHTHQLTVYLAPSRRRHSAWQCWNHFEEEKATKVAAPSLRYLHGREDLDGAAIDIQILLISCTRSALLSNSWSGHLNR